MRHAAFPKAIPTGAAEKRRSRMLPVSCRGIRPALCASAFPCTAATQKNTPHGRPETEASPPASPGPAEAGLSPRCRTARRRSSSPQKSRPSQGLQLHAFPAAPLFFGNDAAWKAHPGKAAFLRFFPAEARLFRPWTEQNAGKLRKNVIFQLTLVFNFTNTALSLPRGAARSACTASCGPAAALPSSRGRNDSRNPCPEFEKEFHFYIEEEPCLR